MPIDQHTSLKIRYVTPTICSNSCEFCHREGMSNELSFNYNIVSNVLKSLRDCSFDTVIISGGDPIDVEHVKTVSMLCKKYGYFTAITTTGRDINKTIWETLAKNIDFLNLSIPSFQAEKYAHWTGCSLDVTLSNLAFLKRIFKKVKLNYTVTKSDGVTFDELLHTVEKYNINLFIQDVLRHPCMTNEQYSKYYVNSIDFASTNSNKIGFRYIDGFPPKYEGVYAGRRVVVRSSTLNILNKQHVCSICSSNMNCSERICNLRVYADGTISFCFKTKHRILTDCSEDINKLITSLIIKYGLYEDCNNLTLPS